MAKRKQKVGAAAREKTKSRSKSKPSSPILKDFLKNASDGRLKCSVCDMDGKIVHPIIDHETGERGSEEFNLEEFNDTLREWLRLSQVDAELGTWNKFVKYLRDARGINVSRQTMARHARICLGLPPVRGMSI